MIGTVGWWAIADERSGGPKKKKKNQWGDM